MKFDQGNWRLLPGTEALYPTAITDVSIEDHALTITGYNRHVQARWSYLDGATISARFTSPMPGVIRVQITHFKGRRERQPNFDLDYALTNANVSIGRDDKQAW